MAGVDRRNPTGGVGCQSWRPELTPWSSQHPSNARKRTMADFPNPPGLLPIPSGAPERGPDFKLPPDARSSPLSQRALGTEVAVAAKDAVVAATDPPEPAAWLATPLALWRTNLLGGRPPQKNMPLPHT